MIQFNLLPDIKIQYLHARRQKQVVLLASTIAIVASIGLLVLLGSIVFGLQKKNIADLSKDIKTASSELQNTPDLTKMLTVQSQLRSLPSLHQDKPIASRIFGYIAQSTPASVSISRLNVDFTGQFMTVSGSADSLETVNKFTDTLKFTTYHTKSSAKQEKPAFQSVVLTAFGRDTKGATYTITFKFDPIIFKEAEDVTLTVPNKITTRSQTEQPSALFQSESE
jgi:Tfp pilus assembly protein PilN